MAIKCAINGFGRIGRTILRAIYESKSTDFKVVAINDLGDPSINAHLLKYDTTHGTFNHDVRVTDAGHISVDNDEIAILADRDPDNLDWASHDIDILFECTGKFTTMEQASRHIKSGAKKVLISAPGGSCVDATVVYGVNHNVIKPEHTVVSNASCTTNCLAPIAKVLNDSIGIEQGLMTTIHAYTNDQNLLDVYHTDVRRARAATHSMIPTKTGAAKAVGMVLPELDGRLDGFAIRVPTNNVSVVDLTFTPKSKTSVEQINDLIRQASQGAMKGVIAYNDLPLVSIDFNHNPASCIFDATQTRMVDGLVKVLAWYDNEWGFSNRMIDTARVMMKGS